MTAAPAYPLRPFMPADTIALQDLFAQSIDELTAEDYTQEQRIAWASRAEDGPAFAMRLGSMVTLVVMVQGDYAGFASLKDNSLIDMLYVSPHYAGEGVGSALVDALERIATGRGSAEICVESSDTAQIFFEGRGYIATQRNSIPLDDQWLANTTMKKQLKPANKSSAP